ncbi:protein GVQW3-like [Mercenaria mercenaria]|uniref:protein GVQW3-like n=1 Tax=Mercenaria mercenaria TaxID=6596 RepID=UPI00234F71D1|nr:protein GVQW3-like [Mercenaria mercenaria]
MTTEQRSAIKVCVLNDVSRKDTIKMLEKAYGMKAMKKSQVYEWYGRFKNGRDSVMDEPRSDRPTSITSRHVTEIKGLLELDRRITIREVSDKVDCSIGTVHDILHNKLNMRRICTRWIPKMLSDDQKK